MTLLADHEIRLINKRQQEQTGRGLVHPYHQESLARLQDGTKITSVGESSFGYDISLFGAVRRMITPDEAVDLYGLFHGMVVDPCNFDSRLFKDVEFYEHGEKIVLQPGEFILAVTNEHFNLSNRISGVAMEKSTLARSNITVTITPLEAGWSGYLTLEIRNNNRFPAHLTVGMGISQVLFFEGDKPCEVSYADRAGKYQDQPKEPVPPRVLQKKPVTKVPDQEVTADHAGNLLYAATKPSVDTPQNVASINGVELVPVVETEHDLTGRSPIASSETIVGWRLPDHLDLDHFFVSMSVQKLFDMLKHGDEKHRHWLQCALFAAATGTEIPKPY